MNLVEKMNSCPPQNSKVVIRAVAYRDLDALEQLVAEASEVQNHSGAIKLGQQLQFVRRWYAPLKFLSLFPNPCQYEFCVYVALADNQVKGMIQVSPFNRTHSTWRVEQVLVAKDAQNPLNDPATGGSGSGLLRHCFGAIVEASNWLLEVNINHKVALAIYRKNGFQPLAHLTYWDLAPESLQELAKAEADLPNLLPISNADAQLLYQLDTVAMPPLLRQVFDRQSHDFKKGIINGLVGFVKDWAKNTKSVSGYVFEAQRKAAIGYFHLQLCRDGKQPHTAQLTVHPAYTWLYPELLSQMARITQDFPSQSLHLASADYQPEREEYFERLGAERIEHTLLMSRSVWHKVREAKPLSLEGLQLSEVLQSLKPARQPVPSRIKSLKSQPLKCQASQEEESGRGGEGENPAN